MNDLLTVREAAHILRINPNTLKRWILKGDFQGLKVGHSWRIKRETLDDFLAKAAQ